MKYTLLLLIAFLGFFEISAQTATIQGIIFDENQTPIPFANITYINNGTVSNENGFYNLKIPANQDVELKISYVGFKSITATVNLKPNQNEELNFV